MKKPSFLFINLGGDLLGIQQRIQEEGYKCYGFYDSSVTKGKGKAGCGIVDLVDDEFDVINKFADNPDDLIILVDDNSWGDKCDFLRKKGFPVIGSSKFSDTQEHERGDGNDLAEKVGINLPPTHHFTDFGQAEQFLSKQDPAQKYVFKADGAELAGSSKTYVAKSVEDLTRFMSWVKEDQNVHGYTVEKFELQEVVDGIEVDVASWFNGKELSKTVAVCFEQKKLHGLGAAQGCYGQVLTYMPVNKPYETYFSRLQSELTKSNSGPNEWAINALVGHTDKQPYFLEWTPRFGWDSTFGELALLQDAGIPISQFFIRIAYGRPFPSNFFPIGRYSAAVRLFSESPGTKGEDTKGKPLWIDPSIEKNIWFYSVKKKDEQLILTDTAFGVATACGDTPEEAVAKLYAMINPKAGLLNTPDIFYSECIGEGVRDSLTKLSEYGILDEY